MAQRIRKLGGKAAVWLGIMLVYALPLLTVRGAFDAFIKIDGIPGESSDLKHKEWIEIESFNHGVSQPAGGVQSGAGRTAGKATHEDLKFVHALDKASPKLALYCCNGKHIPKVEIELCSQVDQTTFYKITLADVIVSSVKPGGSVSDVLPLEEVSFNYAKIEWDYRIYSAGKMSEQVKESWDLTAAKK